MCLAISNNLLLVLHDAPKRIFSTNSRSSCQPKIDAKTLFFPPSIPFPRLFLQLQQYWHLYCFAILGSTSIVIHSVKQRLLRNRPGSALRPLATSCAKDYKAHSLQQTSFAESPNSNKCLCTCTCAISRCTFLYLQYIYLYHTYVLKSEFGHVW